MGSISVTEYIDSNHGNPCEPPVAHQDIEFGTAPAESKPFHRMTRHVRIQADINCRVAIGTDPAAPKFPLTAGQPMQRIIAGDGFRVFAVAADAARPEGASIAATSALFDLLSVVSNPAKAKGILEKIAGAQADADAAVAQLGDLTAKATALAKERLAFDAGVAVQHERHEDAQHRLEAEREALETAKREHVANVEALARDRAALATAKSRHDLQLKELARLRSLLNADAA